MQHKVIDTEDVVIRFAGDSGDGMQLTGSLFADMSAIYGNALSTFPDFPAEIRAPHGTVSGVSGYQVHIGSSDVNTPGDFCDLLVAMNPAALKANAKWCKRGKSPCTFPKNTPTPASPPSGNNAARKTMPRYITPARPSPTNWKLTNSSR